MQASRLGSTVTIGSLNMTFTVAEIFGHLLCSLIRRDRHVFIASRGLSALSVGMLLINKGTPCYRLPPTLPCLLILPGWVRGLGLILAGLASALANGTSMTMIMRYTDVKGIKRGKPESRQGENDLTLSIDRCILYGIYHLVISIGNLLAQSMIIWMLQGLIARNIRSSLDHEFPDDIDKVCSRMPL